VPICTEKGYTTPGDNMGAATDVVKLEYKLATDPGPGAALPQEDELFKVLKVTFKISSSAAEVAVLVQ